ncbi:hypothetical protein M3Y94_01081600 [Aphelenchoides besseyi]|nr:hypothetical protein M3Y94_01081600 [Aphelenchoides besseyi]
MFVLGISGRFSLQLLFCQLTSSIDSNLFATTQNFNLAPYTFKSFSLISLRGFTRFRIRSTTWKLVHVPSLLSLLPSYNNSNCSTRQTECHRTVLLFLEEQNR